MGARGRWAPTREALLALGVGESVLIPLPEQRRRDAYSAVNVAARQTLGRGNYRMESRPQGVLVTRTAQGAIVTGAHAASGFGG